MSIRYCPGTTGAKPDPVVWVEAVQDQFFVDPAPTSTMIPRHACRSTGCHCPLTLRRICKARCTRGKRDHGARSEGRSARSLRPRTSSGRRSASPQAGPPSLRGPLRGPRRTERSRSQSSRQLSSPWGTGFVQVRNVFFDIVRVLACVEVRKAHAGPECMVRRVERIKAARGTTLRCKGWRQEAILRMLEKNLETAEKPDELIIYGGTGKAARNWDAFRRIVETLQSLGDDETLIVQSGKPVAVFRTHRDAPRVLIANAHLVPKW